MTTYRATYRTTIEIVIEIEIADSVHPADAEDRAADEGWEIAEEFLQTLGTQKGNPAIVSVEASLDGIGATSIEEV